MKDTLTEQVAQLQTALTAAHAKSEVESAAAGQHAQMQQQLEALRADHTASAEETKVTLTCLCTHLHGQLAYKSMRSSWFAYKNMRS